MYCGGRISRPATAGGSVSPSVRTHPHTRTLDCQLADLVLLALCGFYILVLVARGCLGADRVPLECASDATMHQTTSAAKNAGQAEAHTGRPSWLGSRLHYLGAF